jgi:hypothetical protein
LLKTGAAHDDARHMLGSHTFDFVGVETVVVQGVVDHIHDGIAVVIVGPEQEPWDFPVDILPPDVGPDAVLVLERSGRRLRFVEVASSSDVVRREPFYSRLRRTARKLPYMAGIDAE